MREVETGFMLKHKQKPAECGGQCPIEYERKTRRRRKKYTTSNS